MAAIHFLSFLFTSAHTLNRGQSMERRVKRSPHKHMHIRQDQGDENGCVGLRVRTKDEAAETVKKVITKGWL